MRVGSERTINASKLSVWRRPPLNVIPTFLASHASDHAAGLAFNAFLSMFPLILGLIALVGLFPGSDDIKGLVEKVLVVAFPPSEQAGMLRTFQHTKTSAGTLALFSLLALLWSGTNLFASMEFALNQIYLCATRPFWRMRLMGLAMLGVLLAAIGVLVGLSSAAALAPEQTVVGFVLAWLVMTGVLLIIYRFVPNRRIRFSDVWPGALVAGLSIELLNFTFPIYVHMTRGVAAYGRSFGFLFILGTWTYLLSLVLLLGAVMNRMRLDRGRLEDKDQ
jgi:membrane protein